jgi:DNA mismatch endonuclease (patch repair protein)
LKSKNTKPELKIKNLLENKNIMFDTHVCGLPGRPDFVMKEKKLIINVNGCFWHQHGCNHSKIPNLNTKMWNNLKLIKSKDAMNRIYLESKGWNILDFWECSIMSDIGLCSISNFLDQILQNYEAK